MVDNEYNGRALARSNLGPMPSLVLDELRFDKAVRPDYAVLYYVDCLIFVKIRI